MFASGADPQLDELLDRPRGVEAERGEAVAASIGSVEAEAELREALASRRGECANFCAAEARAVMASDIWALLRANDSKMAPSLRRFSLRSS